MRARRRLRGLRSWCRVSEHADQKWNLGTGGPRVSTASGMGSRLTSLRVALGAACAIGLLGFAPLCLFTVLDLGASEFPGLSTFRSATVGDGFLLPLLAFGLVRAAGWRLGWRPLDRRLILGATAIGGVAGAMQVAIWLRDPDPRLNWTFPAPHSFNFPGIYHGAFLVFACGFFAGASVALVLRLRSDTRQGISADLRFRSIGAVGVLAPGPAFLGLLLMDNEASLVMVVLVVVGACLAIGLAICGVIGFTGRHWLSLAVVASAGAALGVCLLLLPPSRTGVTVTLSVLAAAFAGVFVTGALGARALGGRLGLATILAVSAAGAVNCVFQMAHSPLTSVVLSMGLLVAVLAAMVCVMRELLPFTHAPLGESLREIAAVTPIAAFGASGVYFDSGGGQDDAAWLVGVPAAVLFIAVTEHAVRVRFDVVVQAEGGGRSDDLSQAKTAAYVSICAVYGAATTAFLSFFLGTTDDWVDVRRCFMAKIGQLSPCCRCCSWCSWRARGSPSSAAPS